MSIRIEDAIGVHVQALNVRVARSEILAANLANEDTPGFQARDIDFAKEMSAAAGDLFQVASTESPSPELMYRLPMQPAQDGNTVDLATEQAAFAHNSTDFQMSLTFLTASFRGLKQAIEGR